MSLEQLKIKRVISGKGVSNLRGRNIINKNIVCVNVRLKSNGGIWESRKKSELELLFEKAFRTPNLPANVLAFHNSISIKIFRYVGGILTLILWGSSLKKGLWINKLIAKMCAWWEGGTGTNRELGKDVFAMPEFVIYFIVVYSSAYLIYEVVMSVIRYKYMRKVSKSGLLDIINAPKDFLKTGLLKGAYWARGCGESVKWVGTTVGLGLFWDEVLRSKERESVFVPSVGKLLDYVLPPNERVLENKIDKRLDIDMEIDKLEEKVNNSKKVGDENSIKNTEDKIKKLLSERQKKEKEIKEIKEYLLKREEYKKIEDVALPKEDF